MPDGQTLVLALELGEELSCALSKALVPWGSRVVRSNAPNPGSSMPSSSLAARGLAGNDRAGNDRAGSDRAGNDLAAGEMAQREGVRAVVWLSSDGRGYALWVYDARSDRSTTREVPPPPFSATDAAALALSIKTVLRIAGLDPTHTSDAPAPAIESPALVPAPAVAEAPPLRTLGNSWSFGFSSGLRLGPLGLGRPELRYGVDLRWLPGAGGPGSDAPTARVTRPWVALALDVGMPLNVQNPRFAGQWLDVAPELWLGLNRYVGTRWAFALGGAAALHVTQLSGVARELNLAVESLQLDPVLSIRGELQYDLGLATFSLQPTADVWLRRQRFLVQQLPVASSERTATRWMLAVKLPLD